MKWPRTQLFPSMRGGFDRDSPGHLKSAPVWRDFKISWGHEVHLHVDLPERVL